MKMELKLYVMVLASALLPVAVYILCALGFGTGRAAALTAAVVAAAAGGCLVVSLIVNGLVKPLRRASEGVGKYLDADYHLAAALSKEGWPEASEAVSALNRLMLELSTYRAFQLNQVVEERAKAKALIETITDGLILADTAGALIYSNTTALELLGIPKLSPDISLLHAVKKEPFAAPIARIIASQEKFVKEEVETHAKVYRILSNRFPLSTLNRPGRVIVIRDITSEKELEAAKENFFHMITHDMRTPLSGIQGYAQMLAKVVPATPDTARYLQQITTSAEKISGMIRDILNTLKMERGNMTLQPGPLDAVQLCRRAVDMHIPAAGKKNIKLAMAVPGDKLEFAGDGALLERVIANLLGNSLKFTPKGGTITVSAEMKDGGVRFMVQDTGPGVPEKDRKSIFEKFAQLEEHKTMGFGLGLAMCKMAVELHGGRIWVEPGEAVGSRFIFTVPPLTEKAGGKV